ncbi:hypothetical protein [Kutzneria sp. NPDC052558]|uniref:hypothetical protein n=1 Tax=Kutzneria sp. NPDC052558 TaxID=3364121 RepID=UPI0037C66E70
MIRTVLARTAAATLAATAALVVLTGIADAATQPAHTSVAASTFVGADSDPWD